MKRKKHFIGFFIGCINALFGSGGGMLTVPYLSKNGLSQNKAQASSLAVILPLSIFSSLLFLKSGTVNITDLLPYLPGGVVGAVLGGILLKKIPSKALKIIFSFFMYYAAIRMMIS